MNSVELRHTEFYTSFPINGGPEKESVGFRHEKHLFRMDLGMLLAPEHAKTHLHAPILLGRIGAGMLTAVVCRGHPAFQCPDC